MQVTFRLRRRCVLAEAARHGAARSMLVTEVVVLVLLLLLWTKV
jgi:hypothetical protein